MNLSTPLASWVLVVFGVTSTWGAAPSGEEVWLAQAGKPQAVIHLGGNASQFLRWVAGELQGHLKQLSGAEFPVVVGDQLPHGKPVIALGGPNTNPLAAEAERAGGVRFAGLKPDGFVLKRVELNGTPLLVVGGNDETGTMYAAYELLERLGIVFQLTGDIIPQQKPDLPMPALDVRMEPAFKYRGIHCWHQNRWYMGLADFRREIDQLPKLKMNLLQFCWGINGPYAEFSYNGKKPELNATRESGFVAMAMNTGTAKSVIIGRECFRPDGYMGPPEFAHVQTPEEAYRTAREFLREVIRYAHSRKVQVWLTVGEVPFVPSNLAPADAPRLRPFYCGVGIPHGHPAVLDIWEAAMRSTIESYPEADRYLILSGEESAFVACDDPQTQALIQEHAALRPLLPPNNKQWMDNNLVDVVLAQKLISRIRAHHPDAKLGIELIFRGGQLRALDAVLPKDVPLVNMVNFVGETAMSFFDKIQGRDLVVFPRVTDDGCELNIQLNAMMYDHDRVISDGVRYGLTGVLGQANKARGAEQSAQYLAEGAWNPAIDCRSFYERYLGRLYGPEALEPLLKAFLALEENEKALGWYGRRNLFHTYCATCRMGISLRVVNFKEEKLQLDRAQVDQAIRGAEEEKKFWEGRAAHCGEALALLREARPKVFPGSREELDYVIYKTENLVTVFQELAAVNQARAAFDRAVIAKLDGKPTAEILQHLQACQEAADQARRLVRLAAEQMVPWACKDPSERHILWIFNKAIPSHDYWRQYLADTIAALQTN
jgi:hypothetical protein